MCSSDLVVLIAGQRISVLWRALWDTLVDCWNGSADWWDDRAARKAIEREEAERQALLEHREASRVRKEHVQPVVDEVEEIVYPDPVHEVWPEPEEEPEPEAASEGEAEEAK